MRKKLGLFMATAGGFGYAPGIPGTAGTAAALPIAYIIMNAPLPLQLAVLPVSYIVFAWAAGTAEEFFGEHDARQIVCDEVLGLWITLVGFAPETEQLALGFLLFRFFDIVKPFPARHIDKNVGGAHGVMLDDVAAGIYAHVALYIIMIFFL